MSIAKLPFLILILLSVTSCARVMDEMMALNAGPRRASSDMNEQSRKLGQLTEGRYEQLVEELEGRYPDLSSAYMDDLGPLCKAYSELKKYNRLFTCLDELERKTNKYRNEDYPLLVEEYEIAFLRAQALLDIGDYQNALPHAQHAFGLLNKNEVKEAEFQHGRHATLTLLGLAQALSGNRQEALASARRIESNGVTSKDSMVQEEEEALEDLSRIPIYLVLQDDEKCLPLMPKAQRAVNRWEAQGARWLKRGLYNYFFGGVIRGRYLISKCFFENKRFAEAKAAYDKLLSYPQIANQGGLYRIILFDRGRIAEAEGDRKMAQTYYQRAIEVIEQQRSTINTEASRIGFVGDKQQVYHLLISDLIAEGRPAQAFEYVERAKARALVDILASKQDFAAAGSASQQIVSLVTEIDQADQDLRVPVSSSEESRRRSARGVQVKANLRAAAPELASLVMVTETASGAVQALLEPDETLLEYYYHDDDLYAFVVTRERVQAVKLPGKGLLADVEEFRKSLEDPKSDETKALSQKLYGRLVQPIAGQLATKRLLIVGHGILHYLPFAALSDDAGYLADRYSLRLLPSASVLQFLKGRQAQKGGSLLAFGNPDLGDRRLDLKFAEDEVQTIARAFPNTKVLLRQDATKNAFKTLGPQFTYLHLATHGKFDPDAPLKSGLFLAGDAQGEGFLSLGDLYSMRLNAELVTLSACETGLGKVSNGDDVVGLTRGFLYAGSNSIVASLWEVDDLATSLLMTEFYAHLKKGDKQEALRQAQLATKAKYPHPYYWAAFQLTGLP
ncbi:MAG: CHAT domain-containing protein [Nitrospirae bacterium]|nr:MAG: CHAT domain-containing protein [Nitrospirota bacterium]